MPGKPCAPVLLLLLTLYNTTGVTAEVTPFTVWTSEARQDLPLWVQYWIYVMFMMAGLGLLFVRSHAEARWASGAFALSHVLSGLELLVVGEDNFRVGMIAINHCIVWTPAFLRLASSVRRADLRSAFGIWHIGMLGVFAFSLAFDFRDAFVFLFGAGPD